MPGDARRGYTQSRPGGIIVYSFPAAPRETRIRRQACQELERRLVGKIALSLTWTEYKTGQLVSERKRITLLVRAMQVQFWQLWRDVIMPALDRLQSEGKHQFDAPSPLHYLFPHYEPTNVDTHLDRRVFSVDSDFDKEETEQSFAPKNAFDGYAFRRRSKETMRVHARVHCNVWLMKGNEINRFPTMPAKTITFYVAPNQTSTWTLTKQSYNSAVARDALLKRWHEEDLKEKKILSDL
jgi:hypothetical protein